MRIGDTLYVHAGVLPAHVDYGLDAINQEAKDWVAGKKGKSLYHCLALFPSFYVSYASPI